MKGETMSSKSISELKPFMSVIIIILTLFSLVFFKMEGRRLGYHMLKQVQDYKTMQDLHRLKVIEYARLTSPDRLRSLAKTKLTLSEAELGQIIQISGESIALKQ